MEELLDREITEEQLIRSVRRERNSVYKRELSILYPLCNSLGREREFYNNYSSHTYWVIPCLFNTKKPDPLRFLRKLVTIRYLVSDDATPILGSPNQVFLDLWPFLCGQFFTNFADLKCLNTHNSIILKS